MKKLITMKKLILTIGLFAIGLTTTSCESQAIAQKNQSNSQSSPINVPPTEPVPNPEDVKRQLPPGNTPNEGFFPPADPNADVGEKVAAETALRIAARQFIASNSAVIKSSLMSYNEARQQLSMPIEETHQLFNTPVRVIELNGTFKSIDRRRSQEKVPTSTPTFTKGYIILRAADGLLLFSHFLKE
ncbi:hypothetical protein NIES4071_109520 (plasmid) [Calothrix sp. NIES-4071]|nr:hypothetical protein NIES4071_109520 [Calothrix sp. NIES-4071]BAZ65215.1 hypothetical protein NIES4105_109480 [Calothrix sp. NIES-4105]